MSHAHLLSHFDRGASLFFAPSPRIHANRMPSLSVLAGNQMPKTLQFDKVISESVVCLFYDIHLLKFGMHISQIRYEYRSEFCAFRRHHLAHTHTHTSLYSIDYT